MAKKRKPSNPAGHRERTKPARRTKTVSAAILKKYRYLFGGKISPAKKFASMARAGKKRTAAKKKNLGFSVGTDPDSIRSNIRIIESQLRDARSARPRNKETIHDLQIDLRGQKRLLKKAGKKKNAGKKRRSNPDEQAAERYEYFHGRKPESVTTVTERIKGHGVLSGIGKLHSLVVLAVDGRTEVTLGKFGGALLAQNEKGNQLFIRGGNQSVNLADFGIKGAHENELLGAGVEVAYHTQKDHLTPETGGKGIYHHVFGKGGSRLPVVLYDVRNKLLHFAGGGYTLPEVGIHG